VRDKQGETAGFCVGTKPIVGAAKNALSPTLNASVFNGACARLSETEHSPVQPCKLDLCLHKASHQASGPSGVVEKDGELNIIASPRSVAT
jgi:hypothetical protein